MRLKALIVAVAASIAALTALSGCSSQEPYTPPEATPVVSSPAIGQDGVLRVVGLMTVPPWTPEPEASRPHFRALRELRHQLEQDFSIALPELSMGMSADFEVAIEEGATYVRIGSALFGARNAGAWKPVRSPDSDSYYLQV